MPMDAIVQKKGIKEKDRPPAAARLHRVAGKYIMRNIMYIVVPLIMPVKKVYWILC